MQSEPAKTHGAAALPWSDLQSFLAVAESGQLARAAQAMGVDASTMGRRLRRLEKRLGQTLFEQSRTGHVPTGAGERLLAQVRAMQRAAEPIQQHQPDAGGITGLLRVSVSEGFGTWIVAPLLRSFTAQHPLLTIELAATSGFLNPSRREADMAILLARPRSGPVVSRKLADYSLRLYANPRFLAEQPPIHSVAALVGLPLIGYIPDLLYAPELRYLNEIGEGLEPTLRSSSINAQYRLIAAAAGIGVLPRFIGDAAAELVPVLPERQIRRTFWIVTHQDTRRLARVQAFQSWLIAQVEQHRARLLG